MDTTHPGTLIPGVAKIGPLWTIFKNNKGIVYRAFGEGKSGNLKKGAPPPHTVFVWVKLPLPVSMSSRCPVLAEM